MGASVQSFEVRGVQGSKVQRFQLPCYLCVFDSATDTRSVSDRRDQGEIYKNNNLLALFFRLHHQTVGFKPYSALYTKEQLRKSDRTEEKVDSETRSIESGVDIERIQSFPECYCVRMFVGGVPDYSSILVTVRYAEMHKSYISTNVEYLSSTYGALKAER